jgi:hypothetical protein
MLTGSGLSRVPKPFCTKVADGLFCPIHEG